MRKTAMILITGLVMLLSANHAKACDYMVWISTSAHPNSMGSFDTITITEGETVPLFAVHMYGLISYFQDPIRQFIWTRNGIPFDTTNHLDAIYDGSLYYSTLMNVSQAGEYEVVYYTPSGIPMILGKVIIQLEGVSGSATAGIQNENISAAAFNIYPNPSSDGYLYIEGNMGEGISSIEIITSTGEMIFQSVPNGSEVIALQTEGYQKGLYFVRINGRNETFIKKVILN